MRRTLLATRLAAAAVVLATAAADAAPTIRYNWDRCEPSVRNRDFAGPGVYAQTVSITGLPAGTTWLSFEVDVLMDDRYQAWGFFDHGCPGPARLMVTPGVAGCDSIPGLSVAIAQMSHSSDAPWNPIMVECVLDPSFVPDPARRYGVVTLAFDHELSETTCDGAAAPLCFLFGAAVYLAAGTLDIVTPENDRLTWNDHSLVPDCSPRMQPLPVRQSSWGRVKVLYR